MCEFTNNLDELATIRSCLTLAHEIARIVALNPGLDEISRVRSERACRELLAVLYTRLNAIDLPHEGLPPNIKSDY